MTEQPATDTTCLNCSAERQGEYCHQCGQHHRIYVRSIFAVLGDLMSEIGHWDSRFYRTLRGLFLRPAFLSLEFQQSWPMTLFKFMVSFFIYSFLLSTAFVVTLLYGILTA